MKNILINLSRKIDREHVEALRAVKQIADSLNVAFFIVGATARDYLFEHAHKISTIRKTQDIDIGVEVDGWAQFESLTKALVAKSGFRNSKESRRFFYGNLIVDIVPFGAIADERKKISWPPDHEVMMSLLGFQEAYNSSCTVRISEDPSIDIRAVTLPGLALLKLISWSEQHHERPKDASDLLFIMDKYSEAGNEQRLFDEKTELMELEGYDIQLAGIRLLGYDMATIADQDTLREIKAILAEETKDDSRFRLITDMLRGSLTREDKFEILLGKLKRLAEGMESR